jgi:hypothetical protein
VSAFSSARRPTGVTHPGSLSAAIGERVLPSSPFVGMMSLMFQRGSTRRRPLAEVHEGRFAGFKFAFLELTHYTFT